MSDEFQDTLLARILEPFGIGGVRGSVGSPPCPTPLSDYFLVTQSRKGARMNSTIFLQTNLHSRIYMISDQRNIVVTTYSRSLLQGHW